MAQKRETSSSTVNPPEATAAPAPAVQPEAQPVVAAPAVPAPAPSGPSHTVRFSPIEPEKAKTSGGTTLARFSIRGCFGTLALVTTGWALSLRDRDRAIVVYAPGQQFSRAVGPARMALDEPISVNGRMVYERDDPRGTRDMGRLEDAIRDAWALANRPENRERTFSDEWPLAL